MLTFSYKVIEITFNLIYNVGSLKNVEGSQIYGGFKKD